MIHIECPQCDKVLDVFDRGMGHDGCHHMYTFTAFCSKCDYILSGSGFTRAKALGDLAETHQRVYDSHARWIANGRPVCGKEEEASCID